MTQQHFLFIAGICVELCCIPRMRYLYASFWHLCVPALCVLTVCLRILPLFLILTCFLRSPALVQVSRLLRLDFETFSSRKRKRFGVACCLFQIAHLTGGQTQAVSPTMCKGNSQDHTRAMVK